MFINFNRMVNILVHKVNVTAIQKKLQAQMTEETDFIGSPTKQDLHW